MSSSAGRKPVPQKGEHQNVARAALVIESLAKEREKGMRLTDVVRSTGLGTATAHRLLSGLVEHGFLDHDSRSNRYFVGLRLLGWVAAATERYGLAAHVDGCLEELCAETQDTVYFSLASGLDAVCVDRREGSYPIKTLTLGVGDRRPLGVGAGSLALLAFQDDVFVAKVLRDDEARRLPFGIETDFLQAEVAKARDCGYALNEGRLITGMSGVAVPVRRPNGQAVAAISVAALTARLSGERLATVVASLKCQARAVEESAGDVLASPFAKRYSLRPS
jgi:DNA-binding IclR family transcriptional regulator